MSGSRSTTMNTTNVWSNLVPGARCHGSPYAWKEPGLG